MNPTQEKRGEEERRGKGRWKGGGGGGRAGRGGEKMSESFKYSRYR